MKASRGGKHSAALPAVWEKTNDFLALAKSLEVQAKNLKNAVSSGGQAKIWAAFSQTAKACSACHAGFCKKKE